MDAGIQKGAYQLNLFIAMGRLTADPEVRHTADGKTVASATLAVDSRRKDRDGNTVTDFHRLTMFGKTAEVAEKYLVKGTKILVQGSVANNNYEKDGVKHYGYQIMVSSFNFCEGRNSSSGSPTNTTTGKPGGFMEIPDSMTDEELPFN